MIIISGAWPNQCKVQDLGSWDCQFKSDRPDCARAAAKAGGITPRVLRYRSMIPMATRGEETTSATFRSSYAWASEAISTNPSSPVRPCWLGVYVGADLSWRLYDNPVCPTGSSFPSQPTLI